MTAEILQARWLKGVAITTTLLAVITAVVSARSNNCVSATQLLTSEEGMKWAYYQSTNMKVQLLTAEKALLQTQLLGAASPEQSSLIKSTMTSVDTQIEKYNEKKMTIEAQARDLGQQKKVASKQGYQFTIAVVLLQIAIMLSSVSALLQRKLLWIVGLCFGCAGLVVFVYGFLLTLQMAAKIPTLPV